MTQWKTKQQQQQKKMTNCMSFKKYLVFSIQAMGMKGHIQRHAQTLTHKNRL